MANLNKTSFAVSVTPKVSLDVSDGLYQAQTVIQENVRKSLGGNGEITGDDVIIMDTNNNGSTNGGWDNGTFTALTSTDTTIAFDASTDLIFIKHTGKLMGTTTASAVADTVQIKIDASATADVTGSDSVIIAELTNGEAMVIPRPGSTGGYILGSGSAAVGVEVLVVGT